jgi:hypothetical protein
VPSSPSFPSSPTRPILPLNGATVPHAYSIKSNPTLLDNYRPITLMNNLFKLCTALIKDAGSKYAKTHDIPSGDGFRSQRSIHDALSFIIMMMEDAKIYKKTST